jgi:hypothetical protein
MILTWGKARCSRSTSPWDSFRGRALGRSLATSHSDATTLSVTREKSPLRAEERFRAGVSWSIRMRRPSSTP